MRVGLGLSWNSASKVIIAAAGAVALGEVFDAALVVVLFNLAKVDILLKRRMSCVYPETHAVLRRLRGTPNRGKR